MLGRQGGRDVVLLPAGRRVVHGFLQRLIPEDRVRRAVDDGRKADDRVRPLLLQKFRDGFTLRPEAGIQIDQLFDLVVDAPVRVRPRRRERREILVEDLGHLDRRQSPLFEVGEGVVQLVEEEREVAGAEAARHLDQFVELRGNRLRPRQAALVFEFLDHVREFLADTNAAEVAPDIVDDLAPFLPGLHPPHDGPGRRAHRDTQAPRRRGVGGADHGAGRRALQRRHGHQCGRTRPRPGIDVLGDQIRGQADSGRDAGLHPQAAGGIGLRRAHAVRLLHFLDVGVLLLDDFVELLNPADRLTETAVRRHAHPLERTGDAIDRERHPVCFVDQLRDVAHRRLVEQLPLDGTAEWHALFDLMDLGQLRGDLVEGLLDVDELLADDRPQ